MNPSKYAAWCHSAAASITSATPARYAREEGSEKESDEWEGKGIKAGQACDLYPTFGCLEFLNLYLSSLLLLASLSVQVGQMLDRAKMKLAGRKQAAAEAKRRRAQMLAGGSSAVAGRRGGAAAGAAAVGAEDGGGGIPSPEECECDPYELIDSDFIR